MSASKPGVRILQGSREALLDWYRDHARSLPWRDRPTPYAVWISEIMLQQTRVATVIPYFERWMRAFPDVEALAAAREEEVLGQWQGLGYYSRARNLHRSAQRIVGEGGTLPRDVDALRSLPGIGPYTAGAIASIAYGEPAPIVDGNVMRVFARLLGIDTPLRTPETDHAFWEVAGLWADHSDPSAANQALMEFGALVCTPRSPACVRCPIQGQCVAFRSGRVDHLPTPAPRKKPREERRWAWRITCPSGRTLLARRHPRGLLGGLWEPPLITRTGRRGHAAAWRAELDAPPPPGRPAPGGEIVHVFSHIRMQCTRLDLELPEDAIDALPDALAASERYDSAGVFSPGELATLPLSSLARKLLDGPPA